MDGVTVNYLIKLVDRIFIYFNGQCIKDSMGSREMQLCIILKSLIIHELRTLKKLLVNEYFETGGNISRY